MVGVVLQGCSGSWEEDLGGLELCSLEGHMLIGLFFFLKAQSLDSCLSTCLQLVCVCACVCTTVIAAGSVVKHKQTFQPTEEER